MTGTQKKNKQLSYLPVHWSSVLAAETPHPYSKLYRNQNSGSLHTYTIYHHVSSNLQPHHKSVSAFRGRLTFSTQKAHAKNLVRDAKARPAVGIAGESHALLRHSNLEREAPKNGSFKELFFSRMVRMFNTWTAAWRSRRFPACIVISFLPGRATTNA